MKEKVIKVEVVESVNKNWFERHVSIILPAMLTVVGLIFVLAEFEISKREMKYERAKDLGTRFESTIERLTNFVSLYPPILGKDNGLEWVEIRLTGESREERLRSDLQKAYELYEITQLPLRFTGLSHVNPNAYSVEEAVQPSIEEKLQIHLTSYLDVLGSPQGMSDIASLNQILKCIAEEDCERETMCVFIVPLTISYKRLQERVDEGVTEYRTKNKHPVHEKLRMVLQKSLSMCPVI